MSFESAGYQLLPVLPELVLAAGAMVLLMVGAYRGPQTTSLVTGLAVCLLVVTGALELLLPAGQAFDLWRQLHRRRFCPVPENPGADRLGGDARSVDRNIWPIRRGASSNTRSWCCSRQLGMMVLISAGDLIMLYLGLELMSLALYVVAASNRDNVKSTEAGLKYFVLGALSSGMLLYGASLIYGFTGTVSFRRHRRSREDRQHRHRVRPGVPARRALLQGFGGAVPHVDARRL